MNLTMSDTVALAFILAFAVMLAIKYGRRLSVRIEPKRFELHTHGRDAGDSLENADGNRASEKGDSATTSRDSSPMGIH